jgi:AhpD family alkylhydroperoxidase
MPTPRIAPGSRRESGLVNHVFARLAGRVTGGPPPNIFTTLGRQRGLFRAWLWYSGKLMPGGKLPRRETELVILHVAAVRECAYEQGHHRRLGRRVGLTAEQVEHAGDLEWSGWTDRERTLLTVADQLVRTKDVDDATWASLREHLDEATTIELLMLVGQYDSLATTLMTLRVQPEQH